MLRRLAWTALLVALASACSLDAAGTSPADPFGDVGEVDGGSSDASSDTTTPEDTFAPDTFEPDTFAPDTFAPDTFVPDTFEPDTFMPDTFVPDTFVPDTFVPDTFVPDTGADADGSTCSVTACGALPAGAKRVALVDRTVACPPGFTATDVVEARDGNGCTCGCALSTSPTCPGAGAIATKYGTTAACGSTGATITSTASGTCTSLGFSGSLSSFFQATAPAPVGGACTASPTSDKAAVTRPRRLCEPGPTACAGDMCKTPFTECIEVTGACPATFPNVRTVGTDVILTCPACTCGTSATCTGKLTFYGNAGCGGGGTTLAVNGTCVSVPSSADSVSSFKYAPDAPTGASCTKSFDAAPGTRTFVGQRNLCCR